MRKNLCESITNLTSGVLLAPFKLMDYTFKNPAKILTFYLLASFNNLAEAIKIQKVHYVTYALGGNGNILFPQALHTLHAGLDFELEDGSYRELHFGSGLHEAINDEYEGRERLGKYEIGDFNMEYDDAKRLVQDKFGNAKYVFGKRDCWALVEWFADTHMNKDKADLDGPIGRRNQLGNGVRHVAKQLEQNWMNIRHSGEDMSREVTKFFRNPVGCINDGIKHPEKIVKNVGRAVRKVFGF